MVCLIQPSKLISSCDWALTSAHRRCIDLRMPRKSNQEIEEHYFEMFRRCYQLPEGAVVHGDKPDVVLMGLRKVGIEITNFYLEDGALPESEQVQRRRREEIVSQAQEIYMSDGGRRVEVWFSFDKSCPIQKGRPIAKEIAASIKNLEGCSSGLIERSVFRHIPELWFVYLNAKEYDDASWRVNQCYDGRMMSGAGLRKIVEAKETRAKFYKPCDAYWLLVVVDTMDPAQDQEIQVDDLEKISSSVFEKIIVYNPLFGHVLEVGGGAGNRA